MSPILKQNQHLKPYLEKAEAHYAGTKVRLNICSRTYRNVLGHYYRLVIPSNAKVLEIGCGDGSLLKELPNQDQQLRMQDLLAQR